MKLADYLGQRVDPPGYQETPGLLSSNDNIGIEIEAENCSNVKGLAYWSVTGDESLRNHGKEFKFQTPSAGGRIVNALNEIAKAFHTKYKCRFNDRCSTHIHLDVRDLTYNQIKIFIMNYILLEPYIFYAFIQESRKFNNFCVPLFQSPEKIKILGEAFSGRKGASMRHLMASIRTYFSKYDAANLVAMQTFGSVEFRMFEGTHNKAELLKWINLVLSLKLAAKKNITPNYPEIMDEFKFYNLYKLKVFGNLYRLYPDMRVPATAAVVKSGMENLALFLSQRPDVMKFESKTVGALRRAYKQKVQLIDKEFPFDADAAGYEKVPTRRGLRRTRTFGEFAMFDEREAITPIPQPPTPEDD